MTVLNKKDNKSESLPIQNIIPQLCPLYCFEVPVRCYGKHMSYNTR